MDTRLRVLIVEDSEDDAILLLRKLRQTGEDPVHERVETPEAMHRALADKRWDLIITDHNMPRFSSSEALSIVRDTGVDVPIIVVSGTLGEEHAVEAMKAGAHDYIMKGNLARLGPAVERELRAVQSRKAQKEAEQVVRHMAFHDALTDLVNRHEFENRLERTLVAARSDGSEHALCYLDLDQFKVINDTCGHIAGDELLRQVARLLRDRVRKRDTLARLGGDEFGLLMEYCPLSEAEKVARNLCQAVEEYQFRWDDKLFRIGVSIGLVPIGGSSEGATSLLSAADSACYAAKDKGRNRVHVYLRDDADLARRQGEMQWVARLNRALEENRFRLRAQPIVPITSGGGEGEHYELLVSMVDEKGRHVAPRAFFAAAERYNLSTRIDRSVVGAAFNWLTRHPRDLSRLQLCTVNISGHSLGDDGFLAYVQQCLVDSSIPAELICFEVTETAAVLNLSHAARFIDTLRTTGCRFALDDFGSGLSSFAYLKTLPVDLLKIDGMFVKDIVDDPIDFAMVKSINDIGHVMGKQTVAEFVESDTILEKVSEIGVDFAQGHAVGRPVFIEELTRSHAAAHR